MSYYLSQPALEYLTARTSEFSSVEAARGSIGTATTNYAQPNDGFDVFLLAGQGNMLGMANETLDALLDYTGEDVLEFGATLAADPDLTTLNKPILAADPLEHPALSAVNSASIGMSFARLYSQVFRRRVLLVPAANITSGFSSSKLVTLTALTGQTVYANWSAAPADLVNFNMARYAVERANRAMAYHPVDNPDADAAAGAHASNRFMGILWHQGETDVGMTEAAFRTALQTLVAYLRANISGAANAPFVAGFVSYSVVIQNQATGSGPLAVLPQLSNYPAQFSQPNCWVVNSINPSLVPVRSDATQYFSSAGLRELGRKYFSMFVKPAVPSDPFTRDWLSIGLTLYLKLSSATLPTTANIGGALTPQLTPSVTNNAIRGYVLNTANGYLLSSVGIAASYTKAVWVRAIDGALTLTGHVLSSHVGSVHQFFTRFGGGTGVFCVSMNYDEKRDTANNADGLWTHLAMTYNASSDTLTIYRNGQLRNSFTSYQTSWSGSTSPCFIGGYNPPTEADYTFRHLGLIDDVRVYSRDLSADEMALLYNTTKV